ncbi:hypothetical protein MPH47_09100 [Psychrobacillus psychrodurans]|jgi:hypothetical protein|uniref:hypothetical protein n=1 Tax=Psychrobacillus TaxID=1221880 RepID=UPI0008EA62DA|nr:hypothetical protein [Psychrobacillus psychrodurans]MCK1997378.1 hypothetical protein [Psychrobacillus psychrodurans]MCZ8541718.1 hypothetical protein [Psychrobacillus psychrodurans]SFN08406.1 hypothetical protein SAMN05421832_11434 [Psychrobacillus psychrodurans]
MSERWETKKKIRKNRRKYSDRYTFGDFMFEVFFWIPELLFLPFRMIFWLVRGVGRLIWNLFDGI